MTDTTARFHAQRLAAALLGLIIAIGAAQAASTERRQPAPVGLLHDVADAAGDTNIPHDVPKAAAQAMQLAQKWRRDAQMIDVRIRQSNNYALEFNFMSPADHALFYVQDVNGKFTTQAMPPVTTAATNGPLPLQFLDLPVAVAQAEQRGMPHVIKEASLETVNQRGVTLAWAIMPVTDDAPYVYKINAAAGAAPSAGQTTAAGTPSAPPAPGAGASAAGPVMASGLLQKCLGITPGADRMRKGPDTRQYCEQLPGASFYDQAGQRFQAGDHAGAAQILVKAAEAGNAVAQLRLALLYDQGDGVPRSAKTAFGWYARAAAQGEPESLDQLGAFYEAGEGVDENWDLAAKLYQASAQQGWVKGQFAFGRAYQFGIGVPQDRQQASAWFKKAGAQGDPNGTYWANWLGNPTNNIGFRDDVERGIVMEGKLRFGGTLFGGDPAGVAFHNSAQRALWLEGQRNRVDKEEAETMRKIRQADHEACIRAGRDNC